MDRPGTRERDARKCDTRKVHFKTGSPDPARVVARGEQKAE
jgi:hypothetical protein